MRRIAIIMLLIFAGSSAYAGSRDAKYFESYLQYVPSVMHLGLAFAGANAENNFWGRSFELGYAVASEVIIVNGILKPTVSEERPDGSAFNSFPSGHTTSAFVGAELVRLEYGWGWGAGAYAIAAGVGAMRVVHKRHWWWDAVAGAGIGILSANIGHRLVKPTASLIPFVDPSAGVYCASLCINF